MADAMKLVPVEPTQAMLKAWDDYRHNASGRVAYAALLDASPPAREEAPAEGAGEDLLGRLEEVVAFFEGHADTLSSARSKQHAQDIRTILTALRARTSEPEAGAVAWLGDKRYEPTAAMIDAGLENCRPGNHANMIASFKAMMQQAELDGLVITHPAPASADKLRVVEGLPRWDICNGGVTEGFEVHSDPTGEWVKHEDILAALNEGGE